MTPVLRRVASALKFPGPSAQPENSKLEIRVAQSEHAPIFLEGPAPRNYLIECDTLSRVPATNHIY